MPHWQIKYEVFVKFSKQFNKSKMMIFTLKYLKNNVFLWYFLFLRCKNAVFCVFRFVLNFRDFSVFSTLRKTCHCSIYLMKIPQVGTLFCQNDSWKWVRVLPNQNTPPKYILNFRNNACCHEIHLTCLKYYLVLYLGLSIFIPFSRNVLFCVVFFF